MLLLLAMVSLLRVPEGGIQPQVVQARDGVTHMIYLSGDASSSDIWYTKSRDGQTFAPPIKVNSTPGAAIAAGTIRGPHIAVGRGGRVHVAWMGSSKTSKPTPMLYTRLDAGGKAFEKERNVITNAWGLDGGGSVAADDKGNVWVAWHAPGKDDPHDEAHRKVWVAASKDDGATFAAEHAAWSEPTGSCACCGMRAAASDGVLRVLYRGAREMMHRDMYLLESRDGGKTFAGRKVDEWNVGQCVMSSAVLNGGLAGWETREQVHVSAGDKVLTPPGEAKRKHPVAVRNVKGETLVAWVEGTGWKKGGALAWQVFSKEGTPTGENGRAEGVPMWSLAAALVRPDGSFSLVY